MWRRCLGLVIPLLIAACDWREPAPVVRGPGYEGIIAYGEDLGRTTDWRVTGRDIAQLERSLISLPPEWQKTSLLQDRRLYKRRYVGKVENGRQLIHVTFLHPNLHVVETGRWQIPEPIGLLGAGSYIWTGLYDVETKRFVRLRPNSPQ
jgi:hypothetical protein